MTTATNAGYYVTYDEYFGHVCTCTRKTHYDTDGYPMRDSYDNTVECDRSSGTETGSFYYHCTRCGKGAWSGL